MYSTFTPAKLAALLFPAAILMAAPQAPEAAPAPENDETYQGEAPERYAMVRALEGEVHIRKGEVDELLSRGTPIAEGDVVESRGRGVLQLGDGTRVAFAGATRFTVAALFNDTKGEKQVLLRLDYGRIRVLLGGQSGARFRVDTASGTASCIDKGGFTVEAERDKVVRLKVHSGRVQFTNERDEARIMAGERLTVYSPQDGLDRVRSFNTYDGDDFDRWSDGTMVVRHGESWDHVPSEIRYYADDLDNHGRWIQTDEFGSVWQPNGVAEDWRPYYEGRWAPYAGGMTWVSAEPWAYVAYHHGRWHWGVGVGWFWIPGVSYSPAWVAWNHTPGYYGWAPLGYYNTPCHWGYGAWGGGYAWNVVAVGHINVVNVHTHIYSDPHVIRTFGGGPGGGTWNGGGRDLHAPWQRSPLLVSNTEFRNPHQMQTAFQRDVHRERMNDYERHAQSTTGRVVLRDLTPVRPTNTGVVPPSRVPFEDRSRSGRVDPTSRYPEYRPSDPRRQDTPTPRNPEPRPIDSRRPDPPPSTRYPEARPTIDTRRPEAPPITRTPETRPSDPRRPDLLPPTRDRSHEERRPEANRPDERRPELPRPTPRVEERRPDPTPRERIPEYRPRPEIRPEPRPEPRPAPRPESRPESHPAPRPEPAREKPHEKPKDEKKSEGVRELRR